eukprot:TRINITY_DN1537_c0_g1_i1.p2 TRINITY_DN1537_c0_g1~~TRINITY_DN1537_c0_g1_i1.p2  ORF type:complete len:227 (+),score=76.39 TRINITY_DN1537_c0_g1_i1:69-749(+)
MSTPSDRTMHEAALKAFGETKALNDDVLAVVTFLGATGCNCYAWETVRPVLQARLEFVLESGPAVADEKKDEYVQDKEVALNALAQFEAAPFTLQRLCEVLTDDALVNGRKDKLMWTLLKLLCITSTLPVEKPLYEQEPVEEEPGPIGMPMDTPIPMPPIGGPDDIQCVMPGTKAAEAAAERATAADGEAAAEAPADSVADKAGEAHVADGSATQPAAAVPAAEES